MSRITFFNLEALALFAVLLWAFKAGHLHPEYLGEDFLEHFFGIIKSLHGSRGAPTLKDLLIGAQAKHLMM